MDKIYLSYIHVPVFNQQDKKKEKLTKNFFIFPFCLISQSTPGGERSLLSVRLSSRFVFSLGSSLFSVRRFSRFVSPPARKGIMGCEFVDGSHNMNMSRWFLQTGR